MPMPPIEHVPLADLYADQGNARRHSPRNLRAIADSLRQFGQVEPLVVQGDSGRVIGGNGRLEAMRDLGWDSCDVVRVEMSDSKAAALGVALNRTGELAEWDSEALQQVLDGIDGEFDAAALGFDEGELDQVLAGLSGGEGGGDDGPKEGKGDERGPDWQDVQEVDEPDPPKEPTARPGDIWLLGGHRVACGDSRDQTLVERLMAGERADLIATDPPYGINYVGKTKDGLLIENDSSAGLYELLRDALGTAMTVSRPGAVWYVAAPPGPPSYAFVRVLSDLSVFRQMLVWVKNSFVLGYSDYHYRHENIYYGWTPGADHTRPPGRSHDTVWEIHRPQRSADHPTMKPVAMYAKMAQMSSKPNDLVYDPFAGSGTTLLACEQTGRNCRCLELNPAYVDVIVRRWEELTGRKAQREEADLTADSAAAPQ